ncbi:Uncharacterized protein BP5553_04335 [Venustampulla echinocandica]|uniref:Folliculin-interacting protein N-terminal domain-containing protein n=1 Tax=Venustampulla echinocandica TaxID=2656787 RepID=A0A370TWU2_9HELO|nr:Uncharacterized protein BP5553_04335 [Venustampulla echinocandica]RDL39995.1 Uncharacterized protein BP5553_04335 [Venustampulla echinocandica]
MSLLGKLLSGIPSHGSSTSRPKNALDSNLEDQFTHNLLFPDADALCHNDQVFPLSSGTVLAPAALTNFDVNAEMDLEMRDVRVIIMQEATPTSGSAYLLYDSHTPPPPSPVLDRQQTYNAGTVFPSRTEGRRSISSPRKTSVGHNSRPVVIQQEQSAPRTFGAFDRRSAHQRNLSHTETEGQRSAREYREEVTTFSNCIFGNSEVLAYKGTGTKVHILPSESKSSFTSSSYQGDGNGSLGRSSMRSSKLAQSFTSDNFMHAPASAGFTSSNTASRSCDKRKVLITRMFPVPLLTEDTEDASQTITPTASIAHGGEASSFPFPKVGGKGASQPRTEKKLPPKQKRTPMYAVGLVIHLPSAPHVPSAPISRSSFRGASSYNEQESFPSSFNSTRRAGWTMLGNGFGVESIDSSYCSDADDRIDTITQHWDIIMRTLSHLQAVVTASLLPMLKQADISSPDPRSNSSHQRVPSASISISGKRVVEEVKPFKIPKTNAKFVQLTANCLMPVQTIHREVDLSRQRIVSGIKTLRVVTGQGRWGIWREEARLLGKWAGGKDEGFFFFNLLTGFLGNHTEWLQALGPSWYRRRHYQHQRSNKDDEIVVPARTIIVSNNKLMARRLIFLLSAFLPASHQPTFPRLHRPSTSASFGAYSQSPPMYAVPILREESLRRRINKRTGIPRGTHSRTMSFPTQSVHNPPAQLPLDIHHDRRPSEAASIKTANLPIPGSDLGTRKSSAATTSTATPITTMPHFSTRRPVRGTGPEPRPGSSGSLATDDLMRSLKRGESSGQYSTTSNDSQGHNSRWGSMISGFWGGKRQDSTAITEVEPLTMDGLGINDSAGKDQATRTGGKLAKMVDEASCCPPRDPRDQRPREARSSQSGSATTAKPGPEQGEEISEQIIRLAERKPDPSGAYESPVKTSINEDDGVIDIDVPLPEYLSFETAVSSPSSSGYLSTPGFGNGMEGFEHYSRPGAELDTTINVGGWLPRYHPDFSLQAIPAQDGLLEEIKASLRDEPTPAFSTTPLPDNGRLERWVDVSSAIIADTTNFSIKHIRYRRLVRPKDIGQPATSNQCIDSRYGNVYSAAQLTPGMDFWPSHIEERFIEEPIISMDETLIQAVERIIAQSGHDSNGSSVCSSRSASRKGGNRERSNSGVKTPGAPEHQLEVPRNECKKMVLGALEEIVKEVAESRKDGDGAEVERTESFLREGVRTWLSDVETMD